MLECHPPLDLVRERVLINGQVGPSRAQGQLIDQLGHRLVQCVSLGGTIRLKPL